MELISASQKYNRDFIHKLPIIQWNQDGHVVAEVTLDKIEHHMLYIHCI